MSTEHTPGPWNYGISADRPPHFYIHAGPERKLQWHLETYGDRQITEADAKLIAAAPDLLLALNKAATEIQRLRDVHLPRFIARVGEPREEVLLEAHVAIEKATGSQPPTA